MPDSEVDNLHKRFLWLMNEIAYNGYPSSCTEAEKVVAKIVERAEAAEKALREIFEFESSLFANCYGPSRSLTIAREALAAAGSEKT